MKFGAYHYTTKDFDYETLRSLVHNASERQDLNRQVMTLSAQVADQGDREFIVGPEQADAGHRRPRAEGGQAVGDRADSRRERHRQGAARPADPSRERQRRRAVHRGQPRRDPARARREHAVRARAGIVHRRAEAAARQVRAGVGRHAVSRRNRRSAARAAGEAAARDSGGRDRAGRRRQADQDRFPADRRDQRRPRKGGQGRPVPRGPLLPHQRHPHQAAAAARSHRGSARAGAVFPQPLQGAVPEDHPGHLRLDARRSCRATGGRATSASSRT